MCTDHPLPLSSPPWFPPIPAALLHSSIVPSLEEEDSILSTIHAVKTEITSVDDNIHALQQQLLKLQAQREELKETLQTHMVPLSALRRLPPEIIGEIFLIAADDASVNWPLVPPTSATQPPPECNGDSVSDLDSRATANRMPWVLGEICSYWRSIAISLPRLWAKIHLDYSFVTTAAGRSTKIGVSAEEFLGLVLPRSRSEPLNLVVMSSKPRTFVNVRPIMELLLAHADRWADVSFPRWNLMVGQMGVGVKSRFERVRRVQIEGSKMNGGTDGPVGEKPLDIFEDAQSLRELAITYMAQPSRALLVQWNRLTHFVSRCNTYREGEFTQVLRQLPALVSLCTEEERILEVTASKPVLLEHLTSLSIKNKAGYISRTCQFLTTPSLRNLTIHALTPFTNEQTHAAAGLLRRSNCAVDRLSLHSSLDIDSVSDENIAIRYMISYTSTVKHLQLTVLRAAHQIVPGLLRYEQVTGRATSPVEMLPKLETLELEDRSCVSATEVVNMLMSRIEKAPEPDELEGGEGGSVGKGGVEKGYITGKAGGLRTIKLKLCRPVTSKFLELDALKMKADSCGVDVVLDLN